MKTYIMGDIHGQYEKYKACMESVNFDYENDTLIQLGDICDRGLGVYDIVEDLLKIKNLIAIKGNHDQLWLEFLNGGHLMSKGQGGEYTLESYHIAQVAPIIHWDFFNKQLLYYIDKDNNLFVHGGFNRHKLIEEQEEEFIFYWDRDLLNSARSYNSMKNNTYPFKMKGSVKGPIKDVFVGHTPVQYYNETTPQKYANIWDLDTGAGKFPDGTVTIMDLETKEYKQF